MKGKFEHYPKFLFTACCEHRCTQYCVLSEIRHLECIVGIKICQVAKIMIRFYKIKHAIYVRGI